MSDTPRPPTLGLVEAARLVKLHPSTLRERARLWKSFRSWAAGLISAW